MGDDSKFEVRVYDLDSHSDLFGTVASSYLKRVFPLKIHSDHKVKEIQLVDSENLVAINGGTLQVNDDFTMTHQKTNGWNKKCSVKMMQNQLHKETLMVRADK